MEIQAEHVDEVLATTRAVRRRLDLERPVDNQLLLDCIDLAEQAPTGGNLGSRRWIVVRDQAVKEQIGELYKVQMSQFVTPAIVERLRGTGHPQERVLSSSMYLVDHLAEVPAIVIPTIIGRHDGGGRPGLFDSVIQAAWSFCLALRARGLGTTWVTAALQDEARIKEILDIPADMTEIVLLPVAWTKGTDFRRAPRHPAREITYFDRFGTTFESGPDGPIRFEDGPGVIVEIDIDARPSALWPLMSDIEIATRFSTESQGADWVGDERGLGASFIGHNTHDAVGTWDLACTVDAFEEPKTFGWRTADPDRPGARWRFDLEPAGTRQRLRFSYTMGPGGSGTAAAIAAKPEKEARILRRRLDDVRVNMQRTIEGIKSLAESQ